MMRRVAECQHHAAQHVADINQVVTNPADLVDFLEAVWYDLSRCK
jgi:hypothetical protein